MTFYPTVFFFAQRASTARRALSLRSSAVILEARTTPPFLPPFLPIFAKYSRSPAGIAPLLMSQFYT